MAENSGAPNLTGIWNGLYTYSNGRSVSFVATLLDNRGSLTGTTHEVDGRGGATLCANLLGNCCDGAVTFTKTYIQPGTRFRHPVAYRGALSSDATEIEGRWTIRLTSGKFLMIRPAPRAATVSRHAVENA
jgi:hypothetical protein